MVCNHWWEDFIMQYLLTCRSLTYAQRGARALERAGITGTVSRVPKNISINGCAYGILVSARQKEKAVAVLTRGGLPPEKVFLRREDGTMTEGEE